MRRIFIPLLIVIMLATSFGCANKAQEGAGIGALGGAFIGALTVNNKLTGAAIGAGVGLVLGYIVGNEWDKHDARQIQNTLESGKSGEVHTWTNPDTGEKYSATPGVPYEKDGDIYREVTIQNDSPEGTIVDTTARRGEDGTWHLQET